MILAALLALQPVPACTGLQMRLTPGVRRAEATRLSVMAHQRIAPVDVAAVLSDGTWRLVFATPRDMERGVYVLRSDGGGRYTLVDTWGGVLEPGANDAATWARALPHGGVPARLARCMNAAIQAGH